MNFRRAAVSLSCNSKLLKHKAFPAGPSVDAAAGMAVARFASDCFCTERIGDSRVVDKRRKTDALDNLRYSFGLVAAWRR